MTREFSLEEIRECYWRYHVRQNTHQDGGYFWIENESRVDRPRDLLLRLPPLLDMDAQGDLLSPFMTSRNRFDYGPLQQIFGMAAFGSANAADVALSFVGFDHLEDGRPYVWPMAPYSATYLMLECTWTLENYADAAENAQSVDTAVSRRAEYRFSYTSPNGIWGRQIYVWPLSNLTNQRVLDGVNELRSYHAARTVAVIHRMGEMYGRYVEQSQAVKARYAELEDRARAVGLHLNFEERVVNVCTRGGEIAKYPYTQEFAEYFANLLSRRELYPDSCRAWD